MMCEMSVTKMTEGCPSARKEERENRMIQNFATSYMQYFGTPRALLVPGLALLCLLVFRKRLRLAGKLLALLAGLAIALGNPLSQAAWKKLIEEHVYWRSYWLLPSIPMFAYVFTELVWMTKQRMRVAVIAAGTAAAVCGGGNMYSQKSGFFSRAENAYKIPGVSCRIAEYLVENVGETKALVPDSLYCYLRQYSAKINLVYGRNIDGFTSVVTSKSLHKLHGLMWQPPYKVKSILKRAKKRNCDIVIFLSDWEKSADPSDCGYTLLETIGNYEIYQISENTAKAADE